MQSVVDRFEEISVDYKRFRTLFVVESFHLPIETELYR